VCWCFDENCQNWSMLVEATACQIWRVFWDTVYIIILIYPTVIANANALPVYLLASSRTCFNSLSTSRTAAGTASFSSAGTKIQWYGVVNFSTSTHRFYPVKFWLFTLKMKMQCTSFGNDVVFSSSRVLVSSNCKQSITVRFFTINVLLTSFNAW